ncbi:MAG: TRAP transporter large permease, partial [Alphaproteobacteria bacterium]|nr:TRAP transporter large permease [Alphaproteobacteria bacterium]
LVLFTILMCIGVPIAHAMGLAAALAMLWEGQVPVLQLAQSFYQAIDGFALLAVPLFILAGELMSVSGITERLVALSRALIGHVRGGLAQANILTNMFMAAVSGSALADLAAIGSVMIPAMKREGYRADFCVAVTSCASMMAPIIPPSVIAVIYGSVSGVSIGSLFLGGAIPGVLAGISMFILTWFLAPRAGAKPVPRAPAAEMVASAQRAIPALVMPMIIIGGILGGVFTPTEAGAVAALYALAFGLVLRRHTGHSLFENFANAANTTAAALVTIGGAALFSWILARAGAAQLALQLMLSVTADPKVAILILIFFFFLLGTFLEPVPALIITVPVLTPMIRHFSYDPTHIGIVVIMMLVVGSVTPPVGILAMVASKIAGVDYNKTFSMLFPYTAAWMVVVFLVAYFPSLVTWLPSLMNN